MAGMAATTERDLKKIIALSTLSQLGVIIAALGLGLPFLALFHLISHALFKALLFICAGTLIHLNNHSQELRMVGAAFKFMPLTISSFSIANIALCGLPFLSGFYSKDIILETARFNSVNALILIILSIATLLTAYYSIRFFIMIWLTPCLNTSLAKLHETSINHAFPSFIISLGALGGGAAIN